MPLTDKEYTDLYILLMNIDSKITELCIDHHPTSPLTNTLDAVYEKIKDLKIEEKRPGSFEELQELIATTLVQHTGEPVTATGHGYSGEPFVDLNVQCDGFEAYIEISEVVPLEDEEEEE